MVRSLCVEIFRVRVQHMHFNAGKQKLSEIPHQAILTDIKWREWNCIQGNTDGQRVTEVSQERMKQDSMALHVTVECDKYGRKKRWCECSWEKMECDMNKAKCKEIRTDGQSSCDERVTLERTKQYSSWYYNGKSKREWRWCEALTSRNEKVAAEMYKEMTARLIAALKNFLDGMWHAKSKELCNMGTVNLLPCLRKSYRYRLSTRRLKSQVQVQPNRSDRLSI